MQPTGRRFTSPTGELIEFENDDASVFTGVVFQERYRQLDGVKASVSYGRNFLEEPMVFGVCALASDDLDEGRFLYRTGTAWSLAEILEGARTRREFLGPRAAAELAWLGGLVLSEAGESGEMQGVFCHGDVNPWRILIRPEGDLLILGYGLPEVEWLRMKRTGDDTPLNDAFAYAPPERPAGAPEDSRSDLYSLALCVAETCVGKRVYDGSPSDAFQAARSGVAKGRISGLSTKKLPRRMKDLLSEMTNVDPGARPDLAVWSAAWEELVAEQKGPGLIDVAQRHAAEAHKVAATRARPLANVEATRSHKLSELRHLLPESKPSRVGRATRGGGTSRSTPIVVESTPEPKRTRPKRPTAPKGMEPEAPRERPRPPAEPPTVSEPVKADKPTRPTEPGSDAKPRRSPTSEVAVKADTGKRKGKRKRPSPPPDVTADTPKRPSPPAEANADKPRRPSPPAEADKPRRPSPPAEADKPRRPSPPPEANVDKPRRPSPPPEANADTPKRSEESKDKPRRPSPPAADNAETPKRPSPPAKTRADTPKRPSAPSDSTGKPKRPRPPADKPKRPSAPREEPVSAKGTPQADKPSRPAPSRSERPRTPSAPAEPARAAKGASDRPTRPKAPSTPKAEREDRPKRPTEPKADKAARPKRPTPPAEPDEPEDEATRASVREKPRRPKRPSRGKPRRG